MIQTKDTITLNNLLDEINEIREMALSNEDYKTALSCTLSSVKLLVGGGALEQRQKRRENPSHFDKLDSLFDTTFC